MGWQGFESVTCPLWHWYYLTVSQPDAIFFLILPSTLSLPTLRSFSITLSSRCPQCVLFSYPHSEPQGLLYNLMRLLASLIEICLQLYINPSILSSLFLASKLLDCSFHLIHANRPSVTKCWLNGAYHSRLADPLSASVSKVTVSD